MKVKELNSDETKTGDSGIVQNGIKGKIKGNQIDQCRNETDNMKQHSMELN